MLESVLGQLQDGKEEFEVSLLGGRVDVDRRHDDRHGQNEADEREADGGATLAAATPAARVAGAAGAAAALTHHAQNQPGNQAAHFILFLLPHPT